MIFILAFLMMAGTFNSVAFAGMEKISDGYNGMLDWIECSLKSSGLQNLRAQALRKYGLLINPYFKSSFDYTSNVFKAPEKRHEATIWKFTPGVNMTHTSKYAQVGVSYEADFNYFTKFGSQNEQDQRFSAFADIHPTDNLTITASEEFVQEGATAGDAANEPLNFFDNTVRAGISYKWGSLTGELGYQNFSREYAGDIFDRYSYIENKYNFLSHYQINECTKVYSGYELGFIDYDESGFRNATTHEFPVGVQGMLIGDVAYSGRVGVHIRNQEAENFNDWWGFVGNLALRKKLTEKTTAEIGFMRRPVEATFDVVPIYDEKMFYGNATYQLKPNVRGRTRISYSNRDFEDLATVGNVVAKRDDDVFGIGVGVDYAARKWLIFNIDYSFERRNSNISDFDMTENRLSLGMTLPV